MPLQESARDCEHGYRAAGGSFDCPTCDLDAENAAWKRRLATCGWDGYIVVIVGTLYRASKIVDGVGVELAGDDQESVFAMAEHVGGPAI